jgi:SAUR family protein
MGMAEKRQVTEMRGRKPGLITKTLDRCRSAPARQKPSEGCFSVYVGARRQRFVVRTECLNHPLFRALLEEAEEAFGYAGAGPLELPCDAQAFAEVLEQIKEEKHMAAGRRRNLARRNSYWLLGTGRLVIADQS